jgi:predicted Kef-type K+ transport protein
MPDHSLIYRDIAMVFAAAFFCGLIAWRFRQPILLGYVLAGLILSPLTPGPHVHDVRVFETMAEIGVILLMFYVGIEFSIPDLLKVNGPSPDSRVCFPNRRPISFAKFLRLCSKRTIHLLVAIS